MAKIQRKTQKIFAGQSPVDEKAVFGTMKTGSPVYSNDVEQLQSADYEQGWKNGIVTDMAPFLEEMNGVQYGLSSQIAYLLQQGVAEWDAETTYYLNSFCQYGGVIYRSLEDDNTGNNPSTSSSWLPYNTSSGELDYNQVTNCILSSQGGTITKQDYSQASYVNKGCTISEANVASGFSASNYILLSKTMTDANSFGVEIPLTLNGTEDIQVLVAINNYDNSLCIEDGKLVLHYDGNRLEGDTVLTASTSYTVKFERTSSGYTVQLKAGDGEYEPEISLNSTIGYYGGKSVYLGSRNG